MENYVDWKSTDPNMSKKSMFKSAINIGKKIILKKIILKKLYGEITK